MDVVYHAKLLQEQRRRALSKARKVLEYQPRTKAEYLDWLELGLGFEFSGGKLIFGTDVIQEGHTPPFLWMWDLYCLSNGRDPSWDKLSQVQISRAQRKKLLHGPRGGMKTLGIAAHWWVMNYFVSDYSAVHAAAVREQSDKCVSYLVDNWAHNELFANKVTVRGRPKRIHFNNGSVIFTATASFEGFNAPHTIGLSVDEVELISMQVLGEALMIPIEPVGRGLPAITILGSTQKMPGLTMADLIKEAKKGKYGYILWNCWDVAERCPEWRTEALPADLKCSDFDGLTETIELLEKDVSALSARDQSILMHSIDYRDQLEKNCPLVQDCKGICKRTTGHMGLNYIIDSLDAGRDKFEPQMLCNRPSTEGAVYAKFSEDNTNVEAIERPGKVRIGVADYGHTTDPAFAILLCLNWPYVDQFKEFIGENMLSSEQATHYWRLSKKHDIEYWIVDKSATELIKYMRNKGLKVFGSSGKIRYGVEYTAEAICNAEKFRKYRVHPDCEMTIRYMQAYKKGQNGEPANHQYDHPCDCVRYAFYHLKKHAKVRTDKLVKPRAVGRSLARKRVVLPGHKTIR